MIIKSNKSNKPSVTEQFREMAPSLLARIAGILYVIVFVAAFVFSMRSPLIIFDDATATAHNILSSESLYRLTTMAQMISGAAYIGVTAIFYELFKPVGRTVSLTAALFSLIGIATLPISLVSLFTTLHFLSGSEYLNAFDPEQLQALSYTSLKLHSVAFNISLVFFGFYCLLIGYLIFASTFLPRPIGVLMGLTGVSYLSFTLVYYLCPAEITPQNQHYFLMLPMLGEATLAIWLTLFGVDTERWHERAET